MKSGRCRIPNLLSRLPLILAALMPVLAASCDSNRNGSGPVPKQSPSAKSTAAVVHNANQVTVTVRGAVKKPGAYTLDKEANVAEAVVAAGGLTDRGTLGKLNLTGTLKDRMTIMVPSLPLPNVKPKPTVSPVLPVLPVTAAPAVTATAIKPAPVVLPPAFIMVTVKGAVAHPGTFRLLPGELTASAVVAAGGPTASADLARVNLNQPVQQGMIITVPAGKLPPVATVSPLVPPALVSPGAAEMPATLLDINRATVDDLAHLPGIGPALATRIVAYRKEVGAFRTPEQLMDVKGISPEKFGLIQSLVRTN